MTSLARLSWVLYNITTLLSLVISIVFWSYAPYSPGISCKLNMTSRQKHGIWVIYFSNLFLYDIETPEVWEAKDILVHGLNIMASMSDIFISKRPYRMLHFYQPLVVLVPYTAFSIIYWSVGGTRENGASYIYPVLNWNNLSLSVPFVVSAALFKVPLIHGFIWALHLLRDRAFRYFSSISQSDECQSYHDQGQLNIAFTVPE